MCRWPSANNFPPLHIQMRGAPFKKARPAVFFSFPVRESPRQATGSTLPSYFSVIQSFISSLLSTFTSA